MMFTIQETAYERWMRQEGVPLVQAYGISDIFAVELERWDRLGGRGSYVQLVGMEGVSGMYVAEIPPGATLNPEKHLYDELILILSGRGAAEVWPGPEDRSGGSSHLFEWQAGSLFAPPLNSWHRLHNASGAEPVRFVAVTNAPMVMDLFQNPDFVFGCDYRFPERFDGRPDYFAEADERQRVGPVSSMWWTNFITDVRAASLDLQGPAHLGKRSSGYKMGGNVLTGHMEDWPAGLHDKAHHHSGGAVILILKGRGYTLMWPPEAGIRPYESGNADRIVRIDWCEGSVLSPPTGWFHQHFNLCTATIRFLAFHYYTHQSGVGFWDSHAGKGTQVSVREGGTQISYEDEDPEIQRTYQTELLALEVPYRSQGHAG